ncbi:BTB/POZ domain-containing protein 6 [Aplysia californica]|uniref:BTB/POZ domain-containing protein 6 n=1 Tax=Aplysia californica TaxID=6500 RepID=A0ABM0K1U8_APLCA|nr:BTB/POZ domain-containing protein 6 [Aplysia californica]
MSKSTQNNDATEQKRPKLDIPDDWQSIDDVIKSNQLMLERQYACDVFFLLGEQGVRQGAHKYVLISRSTVFDSMFCGPLCDSEASVASLDIALPDIEPDAFGSLLNYLYSGSTDVTADNVIPLLYAAKKYAVAGLINKCIAFVENHLDAQNACAVMEQAHFFDERDFQKKVLVVIQRKAEEVLATDDVTNLCEECLTTIVQSDQLMTKEELVLSACKRWAESECQRRGLCVSDENCRIMLGNTLYMIRFPLLEPSIFVKEIVSGSLLSEEEKVDVMGRYIVASREGTFFNSNLRTKQRHIRVHRFQGKKEYAFNNRSGSNAISFEVSKDVYVEGFIIFGTCRTGEHELEVKGFILDPADKVMCSVETSVVTSGKKDSYDVIFDESARVHQGTMYTLVVDIKGSHTFAGEGGRMAALSNDVIFTFTHSEKSLTGTTVSHGQLPGLICSL